MVEEDLAAYEDIVLVNFNPWRFHDSDHLVEVFFDTLSERLGNAIQLRTPGDAAGETFRKYGKLLRAVPYAREVLEGIGEHIGEPALEDLRDRLEEGIRKSGIRPVIVIDDMDRLERAEDISAVLRLVKLTAGFRNTTYVLAFDPDVVARALSVTGAVATAVDGRKYLEKIVQVPLQLPAADQQTLFLLLLENLNDAIRSVDALFPEGDQQAFVRYVRPLFLARRRNIRDTKRYANSVGFVLPLVAGEVNTGDLLLLEAIRAWYPEVHAEVPEHRDLFVGDELGRPPLSRNFRRPAEAVRAEWTSIVSQLDSREEKAVREALEHLFPFLQAVTNRMSWGEEWVPEWTKGQRAASTNYFDRYFQYAVPRTDVRDRAVDTIEAAVVSGSVNDVAALLRAEAAEGAATRLIEKLSTRIAALAPAGAETLARAVSEVGDLFQPSDDFFGGWISTEASAARVVRWCVTRLPPEARLPLVLDLAREGPSLRFAIATYQWLRALGSEREDGTGPLSEDDEGRVRQTIGARLDALHQETPLYRWEPAEQRRKLLEWWRITCGTEHTRADLAPRLLADPQQAVELLRPFRSHGWILDTGLPTPDMLGEHDYEALVELVDPDVLLKALHQLYGTDLDVYDEYHPPAVATEEEAVARQFAFQHRRAKAIASRPAIVPESDSDGG